MKNLHRLLSLDHSFHGCLIDLMASSPTDAELEAIDVIFQRLTDAYADFRASVVPAEADEVVDHDPNRTEIITQEVAEDTPQPVADEVVPSMGMDPAPEEQILGTPHTDEEAESINRVIDISRQMLDKYARFTDTFDKEAEEGKLTVDSGVTAHPSEVETVVEVTEAAPEAVAPVAPESPADLDAPGKEADRVILPDPSATEPDVAAQEEQTLIGELQAESYEYISLDDLSAMEIASATPSATDAAIRVDEMLSRRSTADLRKAFTLNDRYRFRRELFGNSDAAMTDALNVIAAMHSVSEAEEYLYGDLGWDEMQPDVKDFMAVVKSHFDTK